MTRSKCRILCAEADSDRLQPILDTLRSKGLKISGPTEKPGRGETILAALSEDFYKDSALCESLLGLIGAGAENVLPLQLDRAPIPDTLKNALYSRNIIPASDRDDALIADRILAALPERKSRLPLLLSAAGVVLLAVIALLIVRAVRNRTPGTEENRIVIPAALDLSEDDLASIRYVYFIGENIYAYTQEEAENMSVFPASFSMEDDGPHWYSREDGHELSLTAYSSEDLRFLEHMPNLTGLDLMLVDIERLPDLSRLASFSWIELSDCVSLRDISGLAGSTVHDLHLFRCPVEDYSVLSRCEQLDAVIMEFGGLESADLSGFSPPALTYASLGAAEDSCQVDLTGLGSCSLLQELELFSLPIRDLSWIRDLHALESLELSELPYLSETGFLEGTPALERLLIRSCPQLRDIRSIHSLAVLKNLNIEYCRNITDYSSIAGCTALETIMIHCDEDPNKLRDASFLRDLPELTDIGLYSCNLHDLDFLEGLADNPFPIRLGFAGDIGDYSGLAAIRRYDYLHVNPRGQRGDRGGEVSAVLPYLQDAEIGFLMLYRCRSIDLTQLPNVLDTLDIRYSDLQDLQGLPALDIRHLTIYDCPYLSSLEGIRSLRKAGNGSLELQVIGCPRLNDWSAVEDLDLYSLTLENVYSLPVFDAIGFRSLGLNGIESLQDLHVLDRIPTGRSYECIDLTGLENLKDLSALRRLDISHLIIPPQIAEQAEELCVEGSVQDYEVAYPEGGWEPYEGPTELLSLEELDTLPKSLLRRIERLYIVGDRILEPDRYDVLENWDDPDENGLPALILSDRETGETEVLPAGSGMITDLTVLSELTGLRELKLIAQPLENLNGIQNLFELEHLEICFCPKLTDASAAFTLQKLGTLILKGCPVESIRGVQNLFALQLLDIRWTRAADLSPLDALNSVELHVLISSDMQQAMETWEEMPHTYTLETDP